MIKKLSHLVLLSTLSILYADTNETKEKLEKVTVTDEDSQIITDLRHSPMPVSVVDASKFHGRSISLNDVLKRVAGLRVKQTGGLGTRTTLAIHGLEGKRVKIFLDGTPLNAPDGTFGINDIPIQLIKRVEIYKGAIPAKFGGDALGGAINVVTIDTPDGGYIDFTNSFGSYGEHRLTFIAKDTFDEYNLEMGVGGFYNKADNDYTIESPYVEGLEIKRDHDAFESFVAAFVGTARDYWFDEISWELVRYESKKEVQGIQTNIQEAQNNSIVNLLALEFEKDQFLHKDLELEYSIALVDLELNHIDKAETCYNFDGSIRNCPGEGRGEITGIPHDSKDKQEEIRHDLNLHYVINSNHSLNYHMNTQTSKYKPNDPLATEYLNFEAGVYPSKSINTVHSVSHESKYYNKRIINDMGLKSYHYNYDITPTPKIQGVDIQTNKHKGKEIGFYESIRFEIIDDLYLKGSYEHAYRLPDNGEVFGDGGYIDPAPNLVPEESNNLNAGVLFDSYKFLHFPWFKMEANYFYKDVTNMIKLQPGNNTAGYINMGKVEVKGYEVEANIDINNDLYIFANYTNQTLLDKQKYVQGTNNVPNPTYNYDIPNIAKQYGNLGLEYKILGLIRNDSLFKVFWETNWVDEYYYGFEMSVHQDRKIESQTTHTSGFEYSFNDDRMILGFEVRNLTDEEVTDVYNNPLMGRTFHLNLRYTWFN